MDATIAIIVAIANHSTFFHLGERSWPSGKRSNSTVPVRTIGGAHVPPLRALATAPPGIPRLSANVANSDKGSIHAKPIASKIQPTWFRGWRQRISSPTIGNGRTIARNCSPEPSSTGAAGGGRARLNPTVAATHTTKPIPAMTTRRRARHNLRIP